MEMANLLISELVTNAYNAMSDLAYATVIEFSLRLFADRLLIEVIDSSPDHPVLNPPDDPSAENGRGLSIVADLSSEWGYFRHQGKKVVYCILPITPRRGLASGRPALTDLDHGANSGGHDASARGHHRRHR
jgi:anti-sigma regulatory factor (Ser/Thr protein kinase)